MGSEVPTKGFDFIDIAVCTIEKANGLVNRLMEAGQLHNVGVIIVDEMHLIGDTSRGYLLELLLTKVLYISQSAAGNILTLLVQKKLYILNSLYICTTTLYVAITSNLVLFSFSNLIIKKIVFFQILHPNKTFKSLA